MSVLTITFFALFIYCFADKDGVPVFVIDDKDVTLHFNIQADPFKKLTPLFFTEILTESNKRSTCVIIFIEEHFSTEDISLKDALGTPYSYLRTSLNQNKARYVPSVSQPYKLLTHIFPPQQSNIVYLSSVDKFVLPNNYLDYFYVSFQDSSNKTRIQSLRNHDTLMNQIINKVKEVKNGPIIAFYTGKKNPATIEKIDFTIKHFKNENDDIIRSDRSLFRLSGVYSETPVRTVRYTERPEVTRDHGGTDTRRSWTDVAYTDFELRFIFDYTEHTWMLSGVSLLEGNQVVGTTSTTSLNVGAPMGWSSVCAAPIVVRNKRDGSSVTISKYQIQSFRRAKGYKDNDDDNNDEDDNSGGEGDRADSEGEDGWETTTIGDTYGGNNDTNTTLCFGKSVNCQPYFNPPILAGLFVTAIFLSILGCGIMFLMDCTSNNRYDDPNSKEIMSKADLAQTEF